MIVKRNPDEFVSYLEDTSNLKGCADILYIPETLKELQEAVRACRAERIPITCSSARTGTTGGCVPFEGALISLERLNQIRIIDTKNKRVSLEAGVKLYDLEEALQKEQCTFRAQPTESLALIGAAAATCASGVRGFRYGSIRKYIKRLKVVLSDGFLLDIQRGALYAKKRTFSFEHSGRSFHFTLPAYTMPSVKHQAGYFIEDNMDLIDLFIGSEGTLGIIAELELITQRLPADIFDAVVFFTHEADAFRFVKTVKELKQKKTLNPTSLEFFDVHSLAFLRQVYSHIPQGVCAVYFEQEMEDDSESVLELWVGLLKDFGIDLDAVWFAQNSNERKKIYDFRHKLPELINEFLRFHNQTKLSSDIAVPREAFSTMYEFYKKHADTSGLPYVSFGHIGEDHLHFNFLPIDNEQHKEAKALLSLFMKKAVALGGTVSAEHGIGKIKKEYLELLYGPKHIEEMMQLKRYFDPFLLLGKGTML